MFIDLLLLVLPAVTLGDAAANPGSLDRQSLVRLGLQQINQDRHSDALDTARALGQLDPGDPAAHFIAATSYQTAMNDYRVRAHEAEFQRELELALGKGRARLSHSASPEHWFIVGATEGLRCVYLFRRGHRWKAINAARSSVRYLETASRLDPGFADPLLGLALYDYGASKVRLFGMSLFPGRLTQAVNRLHRAHKEARYVSVNALYSLQMIHYEAGEIDRALEVNDRLYAHFPDNPVCLYNRGLLLQRRGRFAEAVAAWEKLAALLQATPNPSQGFLAECHLNVAQARRALGRDDEARAALVRAVAAAAAYRHDRELDGPYASFDKISEVIRHAQSTWGRFR